MATKRNIVKFKCGECESLNYFLKKSKGVEGKLELKKFCKKCKKHTLHKETKR